MAQKTREQQRQRRHRRVRMKVFGTSERPRLNVFRSLENIYAQIIDDTKGHTVISASTIDGEIVKSLGEKAKAEAAFEVGKALAQRAKEAGITKVVFDRGGYQYHGRVKALADGAREGGLDF